jgi:hypothetical protein
VGWAPSGEVEESNNWSKRTPPLLLLPPTGAAPLALTDTGTSDLEDVRSRLPEEEDTEDAEDAEAPGGSTEISRLLLLRTRAAPEEEDPPPCRLPDDGCEWLRWPELLLLLLLLLEDFFLLREVSSFSYALTFTGRHFCASKANNMGKS